jgi:hypothetical protein
MTCMLGSMQYTLQILGFCNVCMSYGGSTIMMHAQRFQNVLTRSYIVVLLRAAFMDRARKARLESMTTSRYFTPLATLMSFAMPWVLLRFASRLLGVLLLACSPALAENVAYITNSNNSSVLIYNTDAKVRIKDLTFPFYDLSLHSCDIPFSTP